MARNYAALPHEYLEEMDALSDAEFGRLCRALLRYSMTGKEVRLTGSERFHLKRVYAQERRYQESYEGAVEKNRAAGRKGAAARWQKTADDSAAITANGENGQTKIKNKTKTDILPPGGGKDSARERAAATVLSAYLEKISPRLSERGREELAGFAETMGEACCLRAIDEALDAKSPAWPYVRTILQSKRDQGVRSLSDWDALEAKREGGKKPSDTPWHYDPGSLEGSL